MTYLTAAAWFRRKEITSVGGRCRLNHGRDFTNYDIYASRNNYQSRRGVVRRDISARAFVTDVNFLNKYLTSRKYVPGSVHACARACGLVFFARSLI